MNRRLLRLERRAMLRSSRGRIVAGALWVASIAATGLGVMLADGSRAAGQRDFDAFESRLEADAPKKSAFEVTAWQNVLVTRGVGREAALTAGDLAALPDAAVLRLSDPPSMVPTLAERSPSALLLGTLDVAWLMALLLPLAAIALAYDAVSRDREKGTLAMLLVPARRSWDLLFARTAAISTVLLLGILPAAVGAIYVGPLLVALLIAYVWLIAAAVVTISAVAQRSATALALAIGTWLMVGVAMPLVGSAAARLSHPDADPRLRIMGDQGADDVLNRPSEGIVAAEVVRDPELNPETALDGPTSQTRYDFLLMRERLRRKKGARAARDRVLEQRADLVELASWLSPTSIMANALAALGGTQPSERVRFAKDAETHRRAIEAFVRTDVIAGKPTLESADRFPKSTRRPPTSTTPAWIAIVGFLAMGFGLLVFAAGRLDRGGLAPTKEDS